MTIGIGLKEKPRQHICTHAHTHDNTLVLKRGILSSHNKQILTQFVVK